MGLGLSSLVGPVIVGTVVWFIEAACHGRESRSTQGTYGQ
jgi:hypothetical protein